MSTATPNIGTPFKSVTEHHMGSDCPTCHGKGYIQPPITSNDGNISVGALVKKPCPNPNCTVVKRQEILGSKEFYTLQRKDIVIGKVKATISAVPPMRTKEEIGTTVTLIDTKANALTDQVFEAAHQSLRGEYRDMYIASIECDGNLYNFRGADRPKSGRLTTEIVIPQENPAMPAQQSVIKTISIQDYLNLPSGERPSVSWEDVHVDEVTLDPTSPKTDPRYQLRRGGSVDGMLRPADLLTIDPPKSTPPANGSKPTATDTPKTSSKADHTARWLTAELDRYDVWGEQKTVAEWVSARGLTQESENDDIQRAVVEQFKVDIRVELEKGGLKPYQSTIYGIFGVNKIEDALNQPHHTPTTIRKKIVDRVAQELEFQKQEAAADAAQQPLPPTPPLSSLLPPQPPQLAIQRANPNPVIFGTGDPKFDLMVTQAEIMLKSGFLPPSLKTVQQVITVCMMGEVLGLPMMVAVNTINVINNRLAISGQLMIALARRAGLLESFEINGDDKACTAIIKRKGEKPVTVTFTMADADKLMTTEYVNGEKRTIPLSQKANYRQQPATMLQWRCVSKGWKIVFSDLIWGLDTPDAVELYDANENGQIVFSEAQEVKIA